LTPAEKGNVNRATIAVARKVVMYLLAVDRAKSAISAAGCQVPHVAD